MLILEPLWEITALYPEQGYQEAWLYSGIQQAKSVLLEVFERDKSDF